MRRLVPFAVVLMAACSGGDSGVKVSLAGGARPPDDMAITTTHGGMMLTVRADSMRMRLSDTLRASIDSAMATSDTGKYVVIECEGIIAGHALLDPLQLEVTAHVVDLTIAIHEGHQGKGLGKALLSHLLQLARSNPKIEKVMLHVRSSNTSAISRPGNGCASPTGRKPCRASIP